MTLRRNEALLFSTAEGS